MTPIDAAVAESAPSTDDVRVQVRSSTQVPAFIPFTPLPARYRAARVALVICEGGDADETA